ncbi:hypothetical protein ACFZBM_32775 [Streptomyces lavendulae]|uniref:hypothetical protein n=1 Tax=Streptomyces lavendulae TaxID=1914 RepID=UPI0036E53D95
MAAEDKELGAGEGARDRAGDGFAAVSSFDLGSASEAQLIRRAHRLGHGAFETGHIGRSRFRQLAPDGTLVAGPALTGYYTSHPAMDREGTAVFWRDGKLLAVNADLAGHELFAMDDSRAVIGRALLLNEGSVSVSLDDEVLVFRTPLGSLAEGSWPCGEANLRGNPLLS